MKSAVKIFLILFLVLYSVDKSYSQISEKELLGAAKNFIKDDNFFTGFSLNTKKTTPQKIFLDGQLLAYIVELEPAGFVIMPASKKISPVIGYSVEGKFSYIESEDNILLGLIRTDLACQLSSIKNGLIGEQIEIAKKNQKEWDDLINDKKVKAKADYQYGANLPDTWGGVNCIDETGAYINVGNRYTPNNYSPGCVATSMSQIMHLFEWPPVGRGEHTNSDNSGSSQGSYYSAFGRKWYDWNNMSDEYYNLPSTQTQRNAMGALAYQCGTAHNMDYESTGSTANINNSPYALGTYFRFTGHYETRSTWTDFWPRMRQNIRDGYAVQLAIRDVSSGAGHANVCDGYRYDEGDALADYYYHLNNGWWGSCNAWYRLVLSFNDCGYDAVDAAVFDILPEPMMADKIIRSEIDARTFTISWYVSKALNWNAFELQESTDYGSTWTTLNNAITDTFYTRTVSVDGIYKYRVRAKSSGYYYADSYSEEGVVPVGEITYLTFDGDDSYYLKDNQTPEYGNTINKLDISNSWTIETWVKAYNTVNLANFPVILDRRGVFSLYLISDAGADYAVRFVARDGSDNIIASLRSDETSENLVFNKWAHVAITYNGTIARLFVNGTKVATSTDSDFNLNASSSAMNIGARYWGSYSRYIDGNIDEIRISDIPRYSSDFHPHRFERFLKDDNTVFLQNIEKKSGVYVKDYARNFIFPEIRAYANDPAWVTASCPIILKQPENQSLCSGATSFSINSANVTTHQWQIDTGSGYTDLSDGGVYSGATTNTLSISNVGGLDGYKYQCVVEDTYSKDYSDAVSLTVFSVCTIWNGTAWSNGEPTSTKSALIDGNYTLPYDIESANLTVNAGYTIYVPAELTLSINGNLENHGTIILQTENNQKQTGALITTGIINNYGVMSAQRYISVPSPGTWGNWHLVAFPFDNTPLIRDVFSGTYNIYKNVETDYNWQILTGSDNLPLNDGVLVQIVDAGQTIQYTGEFGNGVYSQTLPRTSGTNLGWKLMKNPYPSPIDWNAASGWTRANINGTVYTFDPLNNGSSNQYSAWDGSVGTYSGSRYINSFQGYFVQALSDGAVISADNPVRVKNSVVNGNYLKNNIDDIIKLKVKSPDDKFDEIVIYSGENESLSNNIKPLDILAPDLFISDNENKYVIQRVEKVYDDMTFNLGLESETVGEFEFSIGEFNQTNYNIYIKDNIENKVYKVNENFVLDFSLSEDDSQNRFEILFNKSALNINKFNSIYNVFSDNNNIYIIRDTNDESEINIYSIDGKIVKTINSYEKNITIKGLKTGIYILKINEINKSPYLKKVFVLN